MRPNRDGPARLHIGIGPAEPARRLWCAANVAAQGDSNARGPAKLAVAQPDSIVFMVRMESKLVTAEEKFPFDYLHRISTESATSSSRDRILLTREIFSSFAL
jgi:hypothetical protein